MIKFQWTSLNQYILTLSVGFYTPVWHVAILTFASQVNGTHRTFMSIGIETFILHVTRIRWEPINALHIQHTFKFQWLHDENDVFVCPSAHLISKDTEMISIEMDRCRKSTQKVFELISIWFVSIPCNSCFIKNKVNLTYWESGGIVHAFLTSALDGYEWSASRSGRFTPRVIVPGNHWIGACLDAAKRWNPIAAPAGNWTPVVQTVA
jgi:hypothetical protein